jgi:hypothetical protein
MSYTLSQLEAMSDRELLAFSVFKKYPGETHYYAAETILRIGRWGSCDFCPRNANGAPITESCISTDCYNHHIDWVKEDEISFNNEMVTREQLIAFILLDDIHACIRCALQNGKIKRIGPHDTENPQRCVHCGTVFVDELLGADCPAR